MPRANNELERRKRKMAERNCSACQELMNDAPNLIVNGLGSTEVTSLKNNTGLNPSSGNDDCTDLNNMNDCLIGNLESEVDSYDVCEWKDFTKNYVNNAWTVFKGVISAVCGLWTNVQRLQCLINLLYDGFKFNVSEEETDSSYLVAGKGISFVSRGASPTGEAVDYNLTYVGGALVRGSMSMKAYTSNFTDSTSVWNFDDDGENPTKSASRKGNSEWGQTGNTANGNELVVEARIKLSEYQGLRSLYSGYGQQNNMGAYDVSSHVFTAGQYASGQHGGCDQSNGNPLASGLSRGHLVPSGWVYVQLRVSYAAIAVGDSDGKETTPIWFNGIRFTRGKVDC